MFLFLNHNPYLTWQGTSIKTFEHSESEPYTYAGLSLTLER